MTAFGLDLKFAGEALWKVLLAGLLIGAGLPAVFAVGIRGMAMAGGEVGGSADGTAEPATAGGRNPLGSVLAGICFLIVAYGIVAGIVFIIASGKGETMTFDHVIPWIEPKS